MTSLLKNNISFKNWARWLVSISILTALSGCWFPDPIAVPIPVQLTLTEKFDSLVPGAYNLILSLPTHKDPHFRLNRPDGSSIVAVSDSEVELPPPTLDTERRENIQTFAVNLGGGISLAGEVRSRYSLDPTINPKRPVNSSLYVLKSVLKRAGGTIGNIRGKRYIDW